jgi:CobQ-like glutamine amidotransferase family enzyme
MNGAYMHLRIAHLYPAQMNIYGDRGNIITLVRRCEWRGIEVSVEAIHPGATCDWRAFDLAFFGGGQDSGQALIADDFVQRQGADVRSAIVDGLVVLAICGGYQLLGNYFLTHTGDKLLGIGALDVHTIGGQRRLIGNLAVELDWVLADATPRTLIGFENHSGRTYVGSGAQRIGRVLVGNGNNGEDGSEGARVHNTFGCYLHGSLLPKNPHFADYLIGLALMRRYGRADLTPLDDTNEVYAHQQMIQRYVG